MLKIVNLTKKFAGLTAVHNCSFEVQPKTITGLIGPNGSGKTTIFNLISGLLPLTKGEIYFQDTLLNGLKPYEIAQLGLARTFQLVRIFREMTVLENLLLAPKGQIGERLAFGILRPAKARHQELGNAKKGFELLDLLGLSNFRDEYAGDLGYAEQKMVELGRALMTDPKVVMLDEPASGIDPSLIAKILDYIRSLRSEHGMTFLIIEHNMNVIMSLCDWIVVLNHGEKICEGTAEQVCSDPQVLDAYLGV
jgi:branched-chain amino acid transport system ATP-binding protein/neutral amino acid transport system ATP-binding protein